MKNEVSMEAPKLQYLEWPLDAGSKNESIPKDPQ